MTAAIDVSDVLATFSEPWQPRTIAVVNDYDVRVARALGEFPEHSHPETDEMFLVLSGTLTIRMESGDVTLSPGQMFVVPKGVRHQPTSSSGAEFIMLEPSTTVNTGDSPSGMTAPRRVV